jgi:3'-phosphoadenosine 5'-phosphosulfate (PAPS) 3'-phosphatase
LDKQTEIGDLVKSLLHVGIGIVLDIIHPEEVNNPANETRFLDESMAEVYWVFPDPIDGTDGYQNGKDYEYLAQLVVITEESAVQ